MKAFVVTVNSRIWILTFEASTIKMAVGIHVVKGSRPLGYLYLKVVLQMHSVEEADAKGKRLESNTAR